MSLPPGPIPFNKPFTAGNELDYIAQAVQLGNISSDGYFSRQCSVLLEKQSAVGRVLLTSSCTAALEMAASLFRLEPGDEVILPSYTFVSTASAVVRVGARPVFVDIRSDTMNIDEALIEEAITSRTRAIIPVHYAGVACAMDRIMTIAGKHDLWVVEDAAQGVNAAFEGKPLGSIGQLGAFSFHETKNYTCGAGGALCINDPQFVERAEILRHRGTNRQQFLNGEVDRYTWVDLGSSWALTEICSAFLYAQLETMQTITERRKSIYQYYMDRLQALESEGLLRLPGIPPQCRSNYHLFHIILPDEATRGGLLQHLRQRDIHAIFHYVPLHTSPMGEKFGYSAGDLPVTEEMSGRLLRLPLFQEITEAEQDRVVDELTAFLENSRHRARSSDDFL